MTIRNHATVLAPQRNTLSDRGTVESVAVLVAFVIACGCSGAGNPGTTSSSGGTVSAGGSAPAASVGGATNTSSVTAMVTGGSQAISSSATSPTGGSNATSSTGGSGTTSGVGGNGGSSSGLTTGGTSAMSQTSLGGSSGSGGAAAGGDSAKGGASATGGKATSGSGVGGKATGGSGVGGNATGGSNSSGASSGGSSAGGATSTAAAGAGTSPGCGAGKTTSPCGKSGTTCSIKVNNKDRTYYLQLPANYNASKPYPVVFQYHPLTGTAEMALTMYKISSGMPDAIYITPQGLKKFEQFLNADATGWGNVDGEDIQFTLDMLKAAETDYCVDSARVFSVGFSYGGMMSYAIGCELGGVFRAIAPMAGATVSGCKLSGKPVAMWGAHGTSDSVVSLTQGQQARDKILKQNNCGTQTKPVDPSPCVEYQGCTSGYPVVWCEWAGDHSTPSFAPAAIAAFFKQF